jgi:hypothetical protein
MSRRSVLALAAFTPAASAAGWQIPTTEAVGGGLRRMGPVALAGNQKLRVSLFHHEPAPCFFKIELLGLDGNLLGMQQGSLSPQAGTFIDFSPPNKLRKGQRLQFHAHVTAEHPLGATLEIFEPKTGKTAFEGPVPCFTPPADPLMTLGSVGLVAGQAVRVSLFHELDPQLPEPCFFQIHVLGLDGQPLAQPVQGTILPGRGLFFDYDLAADLLEAQRRQFHVDVMVEHPDQVGAQVEIYNVNTGKTQILPTPCFMPLQVLG